jgi:hypothetical protein
MPRILDFSDGFTSSSAPTSTAISVVSPSTDNGIARFNGVGGIIQDSQVLIDDFNGLTLPAKLFFGKLDVATAATIVQLSSVKSFVRLTGATATSIQGIAAGADGQTLIIHNASSALVTLEHENGSATAADRLKLVDGDPIEIDPDSSTELIYDIAQSRWVIKSGAGGSKIVGYQEIPSGAVNNSNMVYQILQEPLSEGSLWVYVDRGLVPASLWSLSVTDITLTFAPAFGQLVEVVYLAKGSPNAPTPPPSGVEYVEYPNLSAGDITAKQITLAALPATASKVKLDLIGGSPQIYGDDFLVSGSILSWNGLGLDGVLITGDRLRVVYFS